MSNEFLPICKKALRIKNTTEYDDEILMLINSAEADLKESGVVKSEIEDKSLYELAVVIFVKANFGNANSDAETLHERYLDTVKKISLLTSHLGGDEE